MRKAANANVRPVVKLSFEVPRQDHARLVWLAASRGVLLADLAGSFIKAGLRTAGVSCAERGTETGPLPEEGRGPVVEDR